jgi:hypothetical protein
MFLRQDYTNTSNATGTEGDWWTHWDPCNAGHVAMQRGAIRLALVNCGLTQYGANGRATSWKPRDSFSRLTDGTSNTYIVGEKAMLQREVNRCCEGAATDGSYLFDDNSWREYTIGRSARYALGKGPNDPIGSNYDNTVGFGSWHSGVWNVLRGDGSVSGVTFTQNFMTRVFLAHPNDGTVVVEN